MLRNSTPTPYVLDTLARLFERCILHVGDGFFGTNDEPWFNIQLPKWSGISTSKPFEYTPPNDNKGVVENFNFRTTKHRRRKKN